MIKEAIKNFRRSGWNTLGEKLGYPIKKVQLFRDRIFFKLILNDIMGARLMLWLLVVGFVLVLIVDAATIFVFMVFKFNILMEPVTAGCAVETHRLSIFADEDMRKVYFRMMANDRFQYYTEFARLYGFYEKPKPIRYYDHALFIPLWELYEDRGLVAVSIEKLRRTLLIFKPFGYIDGSMPEPWYDVHLQDVALSNELDTIVANLRQSDDLVDLKTAEAIYDEWSNSLYTRRWILPKYELAAIVVSVLLFNMIDDAMFVPEYMIWEKSVELAPKIYKYMFMVRRR